MIGYLGLKLDFIWPLYRYNLTEAFCPRGVCTMTPPSHNLPFSKTLSARSHMLFFRTLPSVVVAQLLASTPLEPSPFN